MSYELVLETLTANENEGELSPKLLEIEKQLTI
jgi:hypothetical protein